jgi:hypothetical protein
MDSKAIALRLEKDYPSPSMHMDSPILPEVEKIIPSINAALKGVLYPKIPPKLLNEPSRDYFVRTREQRFGMKLENMAEMMGGEEAWMEALPGIKALGEILKKNGGPFVEGETGRSSLNHLPHFVIVAFSHSDMLGRESTCFLADWFQFPMPTLLSSVGFGSMRLLKKTFSSELLLLSQRLGNCTMQASNGLRGMTIKYFLELIDVIELAVI